jgi:MoxR-like ATPase
MTNFNLAEINDRILIESAFIDDLHEALSQKIVGQEEIINKIFIGLLANGHVLLEGVPGFPVLPKH